MSRLARKVGRFWIVGYESPLAKYKKKPYFSLHGYRQLLRVENDDWVLSDEVAHFLRAGELILIIDEYKTRGGQVQPLLFFVLNSRGELAWVYSIDI